MGRWRTLACPPRLDSSDEAETPEDALDLEEALDEQISRDMLEAGFCEEDFEDQLVRLCSAFGLSPEGAVNWRRLADPPSGGDPEGPPADEPAAPPDRESSA